MTTTISVQFWDKDYYDDKADNGANPNVNAEFYQKFEGETEQPDLHLVKWPKNSNNNEAGDYSSLILSPGAELHVWSEPYYNGDHHVFKQNEPKLSDVSRGLIGNWENAIESFKLTTAGRVI
jgi:Syncollin